MIQTNCKKQKGFALLITLLTVGVIVSSSLAIVELSLMQLDLSVDSRDAEIAFSAANAAKECAQYIRTTEATNISNGTNTFSTNCLGEGFSVRRVSSLGFGVAGGANGDVWRYSSEIDWDSSGSARCSVVDMIVVYAETGNITIGTGGGTLPRVISNYRNNTMLCQRGSECTIIAASGYNSTCSAKDNQGVLKREVLLEY